MKRPTIVELQAEINDLKIAAAKFMGIIEELRKQVKDMDREVELADAAVSHYKTQRDKLLGFFHGVYADDKVVLRDDYSGAEPYEVPARDTFMASVSTDVEIPSRTDEIMRRLKR